MVPVRRAAAERKKDAGAGDECDALALEKQPQRGIVSDAHDFVGDLDLEMQVADHPAETRGLNRNPHFQNRLVFLRDDETRLVLKNCGTVRERPIEIEAKLATILGDPAPAPFRERESVNRDARDRERQVWFGDGLVNDFQRLQNRK